MITVVITVVVLLILLGIFMGSSSRSIDQAAENKVRQEMSEIKKGVDSKRLINSKEGEDEKTINRGFIKAIIIDAPEDFVSFDEDTVTGYIIDLSTINYEKLSTGHDYLSKTTGDTATFGKEDLYVYDGAGTVYYLKGFSIEGGEGISYTDKGEISKEGPYVEVLSSQRGEIKIKVTPRYGGDITSVIVGSKNATTTDGTIFETIVTKSGPYIVVATEEGGSSTRTTVTVSDISEEISETPIITDLYINDHSLYTNKKLSTLNIRAENSEMMSIYKQSGTVAGAIQVPQVTELAKWRNYEEDISIQLEEGRNYVYAWCKNKDNIRSDYKVTEVILDTIPPTKNAPLYVTDGFKIIVTPMQTDLSELTFRYGHKKAGDTKYTWQNTDTITNIEPGTEYMLITEATDAAGNVSESKSTTTTATVTIPSNITITASPATGWTKLVNVIIHYPGTHGVEPYENLYRIDGGDWQKASSDTEEIKIIANCRIEAVVSAKFNGVDIKMGESKFYDVKNVDRIKPAIYDLTKEHEEYVQQGYDIIFKLIDEESGVVAWNVTTSNVVPTSWHENFQATNELIERRYRIPRSGTYYVWVLDESGQTQSQKIDIYNIDLTNPEIRSVNVTYGNGEAMMTVKARDEELGIVAYAFTKGQGVNVGNVNWIPIDKTTQEETFNHNITENDTYKIWVKDISGRVSSQERYVKVKYTVTYNYTANGGKSMTGATQRIVGCNMNVDLSPTATKDYSRFIGWNQNSAATVGRSVITLSDQGRGQEDITIYAIFRYVDTISFSKSSNNKVSELYLTITKTTPVTKLQYKIGNGSWINYTTPVFINQNVTVYARSMYGSDEITTNSISITNICVNHNFRTATCTTDSRCTICGKINGGALGHDYSPYWSSNSNSHWRACTRSGCTSKTGNAGHSGGSATCTSQARCSTCGGAYGGIGGHNFGSATCTSPSTCSRCGGTTGSALGHTGGSATCTSRARCSRCGSGYGSYGSHRYGSATCTSARRCSRCGATSGSALGHAWSAWSSSGVTGAGISRRCSRCGAVDVKRR